MLDAKGIGAVRAARRPAVPRRLREDKQRDPSCDCAAIRLGQENSALSIAFCSTASPQA